MADTAIQLGSVHGFASSKGKNINGGDDVDSGFVSSAGAGQLMTVAAMRSRLVTLDGTYYTTARLNQMTFNDMQYAIRLGYDAATVK